jgi:ATP-dependent RNA helicase DeaD
MLYENKHIEKSLNEMGFEDFTEIQKETIPLLIKGSDVIGHSQTGTGKTAAFAIPILEKIDYTSDKIQAIILCPTRELVVQVKREIDKIGKYIPGLKTISVYGGEPISKQIGHLKRRPQIVVGTPGRTIDHINRKLIKLQNVKFCVLDEADEMLKMGFKEDIEIILGATNPERQTVLFSATMPRVIIGISKKYMRDAKVVSVVQTEQTAKDITQYYYQVADKNKVEAVARLLHVYAPKLTLIFCNTKRKVDDVTRELTKKGYNVDKIHGDLQQTSRLDVLNKFHNGVLDMVVATDVAARGLDIKNVEAVINYDVPEKADYYVHRIGRTGRIGNKGYSFTLVSKREASRITSIMNFTKADIKKRNVPTPEKVIRVKQEKQIEEIQNIIDTENSDLYFDIAYALLNKNEPELVVRALLNKIDKKDSSKQIQGDINEDFKRSRNDSRGRSGNSRGKKNQIRFHINLGSGVGLSPKGLVALISEKTGLQSRDIDDVFIKRGFSYFSTNDKNTDKVMKNMRNFRYAEKRASIQVAKDR